MPTLPHKYKQQHISQQNPLALMHILMSSCSLAAAGFKKRSNLKPVSPSSFSLTLQQNVVSWTLPTSLNSIFHILKIRHSILLFYVLHLLVVTPSQCPWDHFIQLFRHQFPQHATLVLPFSLPGLFKPELSWFQYAEDTYIKPKISLEFQDLLSTELSVLST